MLKNWKELAIIVKYVACLGELSCRDTTKCSLEPQCARMLFGKLKRDVDGVMKK